MSFNRAPWILAGLHNLVPSTPKRAAVSAEEDVDNDYAEADLSQCVSSSHDQSNSATAGGSREGTCCKILEMF